MRWDELVAECTWMPLTELKVDTLPGPFPSYPLYQLRVIVKTLDTRTGQPTAITHAYPLPDVEGYGLDGSDAERFMLDWLHRLLRDVATHEAAEWFKRGGVIVFDPHEGGKT